MNWKQILADFLYCMSGVIIGLVIANITIYVAKTRAPKAEEHDCASITADIFIDVFKNDKLTYRFNKEKSYPICSEQCVMLNPGDMCRFCHSSDKHLDTHIFFMDGRAISAHCRTKEDSVITLVSNPISRIAKD